MTCKKVAEVGKSYFRRFLYAENPAIVAGFKKS